MKTVNASIKVALIFNGQSTCKAVRTENFVNLVTGESLLHYKGGGMRTKSIGTQQIPTTRHMWSIKLHAIQVIYNACRLYDIVNMNFISHPVPSHRLT